jgi:alpha-D-ribose 1-methylphosphonate 5-triphosphate synthase subunit PhnG
MADIETRQGWMGLLARAPSGVLSDLWIKLGIEPRFQWLRPPEFGGVMVRGRMGGTGAPFNLGEITITRCSLRLQDPESVGHGYVQGRDREKARQAALIDALMQTARAPEIRDALLEPLAQEMQASRNGRAARAAATRVEFFTMVRGED